LIKNLSFRLYLNTFCIVAIIFYIFSCNSNSQNDDIGQTGMEVISEIKQIYENYNFKTQILVASIRHPIHVKEAALFGADIATVPYKVYESMFKHALTDVGIKRFLDDWDKLQKDLKKR